MESRTDQKDKMAYIRLFILSRVCVHNCFTYMLNTLVCRMAFSAKLLASISKIEIAASFATLGDSGKS